MHDLDIAPDLQTRIAAIATRSARTASEVVADALENGHSLDWQEQALNQVSAGIAAADAGEFATDAEVERVRTKHRPA